VLSVFLINKDVYIDRSLWQYKLLFLHVYLKAFLIELSSNRGGHGWNRRMVD